jgi:hypothetical protein
VCPSTRATLPHCQLSAAQWDAHEPDKSVAKKDGGCVAGPGATASMSARAFSRSPYVYALAVGPLQAIMQRRLSAPADSRHREFLMLAVLRRTVLLLVYE